MYSQGGRVNPAHLRFISENIRRKGHGSDKILAHINEDEANELAQHHGYNINPYTGLPQFGLDKELKKLFGKKQTDEQGNVHRTGLRRAFHGLHGIEKSVRPVAKVALPILGAMAGNMFGGPMGGMIGGGMGGALSSKHHKLDHALFGAGLGAVGSYLLPQVGGAFGVSPSSQMGSILGMNTPSLSTQLGGIGSLFGMGKNAASLPGMGKKEGILPQEGQMFEQESQTGGGFGSGILGGLKGRDLIDAALLGTAAVGAIGGREKVPKEASIQEMMQRNKPQWGPEDQERRVKALNRKYIPEPEGYRPGYNPQHVYFEDVNPPTEYYAYGGRVDGYTDEDDEGYAYGGYIDGDSGGQDDDVDMMIPEGSYVADATTISLLGDGNSKNGNAKLKKMEDSFLRSGIVRGNVPRAKHNFIKAKVSPGERVIPPNVVNAIGKKYAKDENKGHKVLDKMRNNLRAQKGVKKFLPPKSKPIDKYMK